MARFSLNTAEPWLVFIRFTVLDGRRRLQFFPHPVNALEPLLVPGRQLLFTLTFHSLLSVEVLQVLRQIGQVSADNAVSRHHHVAT